MSFIIYEKESTYIFHADHKKWYNCDYATEAAAKAAMTRAIKKGLKNSEDYAIVDRAYFHLMIEKQVTKRNLLTNQEFQIPINQPACTDPSTETYHSM